MNTPSPPIEKSPCRLRLARPEDAAAISHLYVRTYTPEEGGEARDHYPFPQVMEPEGVAGLVASGEVVWVVCQAPDGAIIGSAAAVRNIGDVNDRIGEVFGIAVDVERRYRGTGSALLRTIVEELNSSADFILCEARTAEAGGWKVARKAGFLPVGYEPYAHAMPVGFESMLLTAWFDRSRSPGQHPAAEGCLNQSCLQLAGAVLRHDLLTSKSPVDSVTRCPSRAEEKDAQLDGGVVTVRRDDLAGQEWFEGPRAMVDRLSGIVGLRPLQGMDHRGFRFERPYYVASSGASDLGAARVVYDRTDARARILGLRTRTGGVRRALLGGIVRDLVSLAGESPLVILACARADDEVLHAELDSLGFFPTAYLPGLISAHQGRGAALQYTRLIGRSLRDSVRSVTALDWPEAREVIEHVLCFESGK